MTILALAYGPVLKTGQVNSYDASGNIVTDGSIKDDGYYQKGVTRSYSRLGDVVTDNVTGLEWQDHDDIIKPWITNANWLAHDYYNTSGDTAATYCTNHPLQGGGWKLPLIRELQTLVDYSEYNPSVTQGIFNHISNDYYWSSSTVVGDVVYAWYVAFGNGITHWYTYSHKRNSYNVRCVRGGQLTPPDLSRSDNIVADGATGLQWQDDWRVGVGTRTWTAAIDFCENTLTLGGYNDWRLPNANELLSIVNYGRHDPALDIYSFQNHTSSSYWSSTSATQVYYPQGALFVDFNSGKAEWNGKSAYNYVRCVRGGQNAINPSIIMYLLD